MEVRFQRLMGIRGLLYKGKGTTHRGIRFLGRISKSLINQTSESKNVHVKRIIRMGGVRVKHVRRRRPPFGVDRFQVICVDQFMLFQGSFAVGKARVPNMSSRGLRPLRAGLKS